MSENPVSVPETAPRIADPIFIVGPPRSGTTLVSRMLDGHSELAVYHESQYYPIFGSLRRWYGDLERPSNLRLLLSHLIQSTRLQGAEPPALDALVASIGAPSFEGVFREFLRLYARAQGKPRFADKTPGHYAFLPEILAGFPDSPVIFMVRDPRDTVRSMQRAFDTPVRSGAHMWAHAYRCLRDATRPVLQVRYESLVHDPEAELTGLCGALGLAFEPGMMEFSRRLPERIAQRPHLHKLHGPVVTSSIGAHRDLPAEDLRAVEEICGEGMVALGYAAPGTVPVDGPGPPEATAPRVHVFLERLRFYGLRPDRWQRGWFRWKLLLVLRLRAPFVRLAPSRDPRRRQRER